MILDKCVKEFIMVVIILVSRLLENVLSKDDCDLIVVCFLVFDVFVVVRFVV